jgi:xanthine/CO dehydrogenase XdhC/CoxF family maturation factor
MDFQLEKSQVLWEFAAAIGGGCMRDIKEIQRVWAAALGETPGECGPKDAYPFSSCAKNAVILCTLVHTEGSFYRRPGARMLVTQDGRCHGLISGGCLENHIRDRALETLQTRTPALMAIDMTGEDDSYFGYGSGCPGKVWVLLEPIFEPLDDQDRNHRLGLMAGEATWQALIFEADLKALVGRRILWTPVGGLSGASGLPDGLKCSLQEHCLQKSEGALTWEATGATDCGGSLVRYFIERLRKKIHLHLFGAGPDADAVYELALTLGWDVSIYDHRQVLLDKQRFPAALSLTHTYYEDDWNAPERSPEDPCVVMTHNLPRDLLLLPKLLSSRCSYVGVLGAQKRAALIYDSLRQQGFSEVDIKRIRSPIGIDIGARDPWTIALSIVAEIQAYIYRLATDKF